MTAQLTKKYSLSVVSSPGDDSEAARQGSPANDSEPCPFCFSTGMEVVAGKGARRCRCRAEVRRAKLRAAARIPSRYERCSLANYQVAPGNSTQLRAFSYAFTLVNKYPAVGRGLLLIGPVGTGKTHLSAAILGGLMEKGIPCLFYEIGALLKEIQNSYDSVSGNSESQVLAPVYETEVLVLDELGASKPTDWVRDTMMQIIGARYNERRLTVFTTNYKDERHDGAAETLEDRIGVRLRSRLYEMCRTVLIEGEDYRRRFDAQQP